MEGKLWTRDRILNLIFAVFILPIPLPRARSTASALAPGAPEESAFSILMLGIGGNIALMPVVLGLMTIFWETPNVSSTEIAWGSAEVAAGLAALTGLYVARGSIVVGLALVAMATVAMMALASWALLAIAVMGAIVAVCAVARRTAQTPASPLTA